MLRCVQSGVVVVVVVQAQVQVVVQQVQVVRGSVLGHGREQTRSVRLKHLSTGFCSVIAAANAASPRPSSDKTNALGRVSSLVGEHAFAGRRVYAGPLYLVSSGLFCAATTS